MMDGTGATAAAVDATAGDDDDDSANAGAGVGTGAAVGLLVVLDVDDDVAVVSGLGSANSVHPMHISVLLLSRNRIVYSHVSSLPWHHVTNIISFLQFIIYIIWFATTY